MKLLVYRECVLNLRPVLGRDVPLLKLRECIDVGGRRFDRSAFRGESLKLDPDVSDLPIL
jgi:hypothetical protein